MDDICIRQLRLHDAADLRILEGEQLTRAACEELIRGLKSDPERLAYLILEKAEAVCLAVFFNSGLQRTSARLDLDFGVKGRPSDEKMRFILDRLIYKAFFEENIHKVSLLIPTDDAVLERCACDCGMIQEAILHDEIQRNDRPEDAGLFYIVPAEYRSYNVAFVPFQRGICVVRGGEDYIDSAELFHYGDKISDSFVLKVARYLDLLDDEDRFLPRNSEAYSLLDDSLLPSEVSKAAEQLREYFLKKRTSFDLNCKFRKGTDFQHAVWYLLTDIPYGTTVSYEEIALRLAEDPSEARKLTRAVGAACSDNPLQVIIPCHRVIGKNGKLIGYAQGIDLKDFLLQHESLFMTLI